MTATQIGNLILEHCEPMYDSVGDYSHHRILVNDGNVYKYNAKDLPETPTDAQVKTSIEGYFADVTKVTLPSEKSFSETAIGKKISEL